MSHVFFRGALAALALALALAGTVAHAATDDAQEALHQRFLRGDAAMTHSAAMPSVQPGPNARHLIYLGVDPREAIARAAESGEMVRPAPAAARPALPIQGDDIYARNARAAAARDMR